MSARSYTLSEPGMLDGHPVRCCPSSRHVWDSPDGFVPADGREVKCRTCPATASAIPEGQLDRLLRQVDGGAVGAAQMVIRAALDQALRVTPRDVDAPPSDAAVLATFWGAVRALPPVPPGAVGVPEPDCMCGEPAAVHVWNDWAKSRPCAEAEDSCGCLNYTPAPPCTCGKPAASHLLDSPTGKRPYAGDEDWWCMDYTPASAPAPA